MLSLMLTPTHEPSTRGTSVWTCAATARVTSIRLSDDRRQSTAAVRMAKDNSAAHHWLSEHDSTESFKPISELDPEGQLALERVPGFFEPALIPALLEIDAIQKALNVFGAVGEIGVYHGRGFVPLALLRRDGEVAVAVDCFGEQQHNQDDSGVGSEVAFRNALRLFRCTANVNILRCDSTTLTAEELRTSAQGPLRLLSIDGSHTESAVLSDLSLAAAVLAEGGVALLDDAVNPDWPGVITGLARHVFSDAQPRLLPFALGYNKAFLAAPQWLDAYRDALSPLARKHAALLGYECAILPAGWIAAHFANDAR